MTNRFNKVLVSILAAVITLTVAIGCLMTMTKANADQAVSGDKKSLSIVSISDTHILPPSMISDTDDYTDALNSDRKIFTESTAILDRMLKEVRKLQPEVLMIPGDLTKDGELEAHQYMAAKLEELKADMPNLKIYVINGNHDVNNKYAYNFNTADGNKVAATRTTPELFVETYRDAVYGDDSIIARYTPSEGASGQLSYAARPKDGFTVIAIDSCRYSADNTDTGTDEHETSGQVSEELQQWVVDQIIEAKLRGDVVIGLEHHGLIEHFDMEEELMGEYLVNDYLSVSDKWANAGMNVIFTGHMHANDISAMTSSNGNKLYDIETGSAVTYPCPMRTATISAAEDNDNRNISIDVDTITNLDGISFQPADKGENISIDNLTDYAKDFGLTEDMIVNLGSGVMNTLFDTVEKNGGLVDTVESLVEDLLDINMSVNDIIDLAVGLIGTESGGSVYRDNDNIYLSMMNKTLTVPIAGVKETVGYILTEADRIIAEREMLTDVVETLIHNVINMEIDADGNTLLRLANDVYQRHLSGDDCNDNEEYIQNAIAAIEDGTLIELLLENIVDELWTAVGSVSKDISLSGALGIEYVTKTIEAGKISGMTVTGLEGRTPLFVSGAEYDTDLLGMLFGPLGISKQLETENISNDTVEGVVIKVDKMTVKKEATLYDLLNCTAIRMADIPGMLKGLLIGEDALLPSDILTKLTDFVKNVVQSMSDDSNYGEDNTTVIEITESVVKEESPDTTPEPEPNKPDTDISGGEPDSNNPISGGMIALYCVLGIAGVGAVCGGVIYYIIRKKKVGKDEKQG